MGDSTFRVRGVLDLAGLSSDPAYLAALQAEGFTVDDFQFNIANPPGSLIEDFVEMSGTPFNGANFFGETPFGWGVW